MLSEKDFSDLNRLSDERLIIMKETLNEEVIDDPEEILDWFGEHGNDLLEELLRFRKDSGIEVKEEEPTSEDSLDYGNTATLAFSCDVSSNRHKEKFTNLNNM